MDSKLLTCEYDASHKLVTYNEGTAVEFITCNDCVEPYYEEIPGDPTDRAAYYARQDAVEAAWELKEMDEHQWSMVGAIRATLDHDSPYVDYDAS
jgi:hypothetical protein